MKNFKLAASFGILFVSLNVNATNMADWVGGSTSKSENKQNKILNSFFGGAADQGEENLGQNESQSIDKQTLEKKHNPSFEDRPESLLIQNQKLKMKEIADNQASFELANAASENQELEKSVIAPIQTQTSDYKKQNNLNANASDNEIANEQKKMESFILTAQNFVSSNMLDSLTSDQSLAVSLLNAALMQVGVEEMSGMSSSSNQKAYNQAIGCVNSLSNSGLNNVSNMLISKYMSVVNIGPVVRGGPQIGGTFKAKCY